MYPGVAINYTRTITIKLTENEKNYMLLSDQHCESQNNDILSYELKTLSLKPLVFCINNFITSYEQESLLNITYKLLHNSQVNDFDYLLPRLTVERQSTLPLSPPPLASPTNPVLCLNGE